MISVLCPTRQRAVAVADSIASLEETATHGRSAFEVLIALDPDDIAEQSYASIEEVWVAPERYGYAQLHRYYNELAKRARGDWLLLWNDDARMATLGWDEIVEEAPVPEAPSVILSPSTVHNPLCTFPIVPRRFVDAIGHFSLNAHCDTWWEEIGQRLGILTWPDIRVDHRRADLTGEHNDAVYHERQYQTAEFNEMRPLRERDADTISELLGLL